jgi:hypothetical protein
MSCSCRGLILAAHSSCPIHPPQVLRLQGENGGKTDDMFTAVGGLGFAVMPPEDWTEDMAAAITELAEKNANFSAQVRVAGVFVCRRSDPMEWGLISLADVAISHERLLQIM